MSKENKLLRDALTEVRRELNEFCIDGVHAYLWLSDETRLLIEKALDRRETPRPATKFTKLQDITHTVIRKHKEKE